MKMYIRISSLPLWQSAAGSRHPHSLIEQNFPKQFSHISQLVNLFQNFTSTYQLILDDICFHNANCEGRKRLKLLQLCLVFLWSLSRFTNSKSPSQSSSSSGQKVFKGKRNIQVFEDLLDHVFYHTVITNTKTMKKTITNTNTC